MRVLVLTLAFLALPALAMAQQATDLEDGTAPAVQLEQTTPQSQTAQAHNDIAELEAPGDRQVEAQSQTLADDAAMQQAPATSWWWLVGAIVLAGIILAVIL
jgi:cytochrome c-type biogenesis protein CcmH/NrfG